MIKPDLSLTVPDDLGSVHFVGIGGSGMSGIARLFLKAGHRVTGSDRSDSASVQKLRRLGATVRIGHDAANVPADTDTVVVTGALWLDNPEYQAALARGLPVLHRAQALAWLTRGSRLVSVAGAHGKTTSTGMIVSALVELGADPSFVNGGVIEAFGTSAAAGGGELFVLEADESDGSFLLYDTAVGLITNVEGDHIDHYGSAEALEDAFVAFADRAREFVAISADDPGAVSVARRVTASRVITFGEHPGADVRVHSIDTSGSVAFGVSFRGAELRTQLTVPGRHNALNAAGAFAVLAGLGFAPDAALDALATFGGTARRFELRGTVDGVRVFDDYAHHPTEVEAVLTAARTVAGEGRIIAVHQPHLYSRTQRLAGEFAQTLERLADHTVVLEVCGAREDPIEGVTGETVSSRFADPAHVSYQPVWRQAADYVASVSHPGDIVITLGCGDVNLIVPQLLAALEGGGRPAADGS